MTRETNNSKRTLGIAGIVTVALVGGFAAWQYGQAGSTTATLGQVGGDFHALHVAPDGRVLYGEHAGLSFSEDGGKTWTQPDGAGDAMAISMSPQRPDVVFLAGHDVFKKSTDGGRTWEEMSFENLPSTDIHGFAVSPNRPDTLYANLAGMGLYHSSDSGKSWSFASNATAAAMAMAAGPDTLYALTMNSGLIRSDLGGGWQTTNAPKTSASGISVHPESGNVYVAGPAGVHRSTDKGDTWEDLGPNEPMMLVAPSPVDEQELYAVAQSGQVYHSDDGGATWRK